MSLIYNVLADGAALLAKWLAKRLLQLAACLAFPFVWLADRIRK